MTPERIKFLFIKELTTYTAGKDISKVFDEEWIQVAANQIHEETNRALRESYQAGFKQAVEDYKYKIGVFHPDSSLSQPSLPPSPRSDSIEERRKCGMDSDSVPVTGEKTGTHPFEMLTFSRVEVIGDKGREYVGWYKHTVSIQDNGRTLKIFKVFPSEETKIDSLSQIIERNDEIRHSHSPGVVEQCGDAGELKTENPWFDTHNSSPKDAASGPVCKFCFDREYYLNYEPEKFIRTDCIKCSNPKSSLSISTDEQVTIPQSNRAVETVSPTCLETVAQMGAVGVSPAAERPSHKFRNAWLRALAANEAGASVRLDRDQTHDSVSSAQETGFHTACWSREREEAMLFEAMKQLHSPRGSYQKVNANEVKQ